MDGRTEPRRARPSRITAGQRLPLDIGAVRDGPTPGALTAANSGRGDRRGDLAAHGSTEQVGLVPAEELLEPAAVEKALLELREREMHRVAAGRDAAAAQVDRDLGAFAHARVELLVRDDDAEQRVVGLVARVDVGERLGDHRLDADGLEADGGLLARRAAAERRAGHDDVEAVLDLRHELGLDVRERLARKHLLLRLALGRPQRRRLVEPHELRRDDRVCVNIVSEHLCLAGEQGRQRSLDGRHGRLLGRLLHRVALVTLLARQRRPRSRHRVAAGLSRELLGLEPVAQAVELARVDRREQRRRVRHLHVEARGGDDSGGRKVSNRSLAHAVPEVAVLAREPHLALGRHVRADADAVAAAWRADRETCLLVHAVQAERLELGDDLERAGRHASVAARHGRLASLHGRAQHECAKDQIFLRRGARADEAAVERHAELVCDRHAVVWRRVERNDGLDSRQVDHVVRRVAAARIRLKELRLGRVRGIAGGLARLQHAVRDGVGLEDAGDGAELGAHVGHGEARVVREEAQALAAVVHGALERHRVALERAEDVQDGVLAANAEGRLAHELDEDDLGHLEPRLARHERHDHVTGAESSRERAHAAGRARVRVRADHDLPGLRALARELRVHDGRVGRPEVRESVLGRKVRRKLDECLLLRLVVHARVRRVVQREPEAVWPVQLGPPDRLVHRVHGHERQLARDRPVRAHAQHVADRYVRLLEPHRVVAQDLLDHVHGRCGRGRGRHGGPGHVDGGGGE